MFPGVTAVLVVQHGGDRLAATLTALREQRRPADALAVVLMRSDEATRALVEAAQPDHVVRLESVRPFGEAVLAVESALPAPASDDESIWLLTEDSAPEPGALEALAATLTTAPSAGVVAPKLVAWDDPSRILRFGRSVTRSGRSLPVVEDELDQGQHDDLSDVMGADPVGMLVRRTLWRRLGGLDPALPVLDDGLDLGMRARLAGYRVVAVPAARVRYADGGVAGQGSLPGGRAARRRAREARAARLHRRLVSAPAPLVPLHWVAFLPLAVVRSIRHLLVKTPGLIPGEFRAAVEVMATPGRVVRSRRRVAEARSARWSSLAPLRIRGDEVRLRRQQAAEARRQRASGRAEELRFLQTGGGWVLLAGVAASVAVFAPLAASGGIAGGGLLPLSDEVASLWRNAAAGWRDVAGGFEGAADPFAGVLAVLGSLSFWNPSAALLGLWLVAIPLAALGGWFAAARLTERASLRVLGGIAWAAAPPLLEALAAGRPGPVLAHLLLPWLVVLMFAAATSWAAAAGASLVFAVVVACAPSLAPALLAGWVLALAVSGRAAVRLAGVPLPALALFLPLVVQQWGRGTPLALLADPGLPQWSAAPSPVQAALGQASDAWGRWDDMLGGAIGEIVPVPLLLAILLAPLLVTALTVVAAPRFRSGLAALGLAALGYATAVLVSGLSLSVAGDRAVPVWAGAGLSLMWLGITGAAVLALDGLRRGAAAVAAAIAVLLLAAVAPSVLLIAVGRTPVGPAAERTLPAFVEAEAATDPRVGTLRLDPTAGGGLRATIERGTGATLDIQSTLAATRPELTSTTDEIADLAGNLASRSGYDATEAVERFGLSFVLVGPAPEDARAAAIEQRAVAALDGNAQVVPVGDTGFGPLWRFVDARPDAPGAQIPPAGPVAGWIVAGQLVVLGSALLLSIPTGGGREPDRRPPSERRRRRRRPAAAPAAAGDPAATSATDDADEAAEAAEAAQAAQADAAAEPVPVPAGRGPRTDAESNGGDRDAREA
ncbi:glycosyltransferase [Agromyces aurantiacus]|uniref:Glycosyltransferase n=1 Tax=Agromyces aurantiacus TaxID=165814 RepID=A0ABV9R5T7_9MICO|nr:glycosyltransferase [Agromyces aurantiacus]MBM7504188.1 GT2 family glycosyltransferase [Agromyces aurantiacus]